MDMHAAITQHLPSELEALRARIQRYAEKAAGAYAANTLKAWTADAKVFWAWCQAQGRTPLSAHPETRFTRAAVSVAFECLCRFEDLIRFDVEDLDVQDDGTGRLLITQGKTDQTGGRKTMYLSATTVRHLHEWLTCKPHHSGPLFRPVNKSGIVGTTRISLMAVVHAMKRVARAAGLDDRSVSGHSCRRRGAGFVGGRIPFGGDHGSWSLDDGAHAGAVYGKSSGRARRHGR